MANEAAIPSDADRVLAAIAAGTQQAVGSGRPEAVLREHLQPVLAEVLQERGVRSQPRDELTLAVPTAEEAASLDAPLDATGRADAVYNRFVVEFEPPGSLRQSVQHSATRHAVGQVQQYLRGVADHTGLSLDRLAGCAFDGTWLVYVTWDRGAWQVATPVRATRGTLGALIDTLQSMATGRGFTASNLYEDFGRDSEAARKTVQALVAIFEKRQASGRTLALFDQWKLDLGNASGPFSASDLEEWVGLCRTLGVPRSNAAASHVLFSLQTYFAIVAKLAALVVLEGATGSSLSERISASDDVRQGFRLLESGELTASTGTLNAIEPGVFSWYLTEPSGELDGALQLLAQLIAEYVAEVVEITPLVARDVMKDLYQRLLPRSIRHRLGEYYTPDWLAQRVVNQVTSSNDRLEPSTRVLDPACGSGTFLVEVIARMVRTAIAANDPPQRTLQQVTENVVGFDLTPLAVQAAKVNYLLAIAPLLRYADEPISLPIFLADSVSPPRRGGLLDGDVYLFDSSEGQWRVPTTLAAAQYLPVLGAIFNQAQEQSLDGKWVRTEATRRLPVSEQTDESVLDEVERLYEKLRDLHQAGRNGMWWQLIRNAFAPSMYEPFDLVVGNPPWVSWETLPEGYRRENDDQWSAYGLRPESPPDRRLASRNVRLDIAMLFVARCIHRYLKPGGRLGFVVTATMFQSELAGRGFRRRRIGDGETYRFVHIDDMSSLQVFDEATNQTAVLIAQRDVGRAQGPVSITRWEASGARRIPTSLELDAVLQMTKRRNLYGEPADPEDPASPLLAMPRPGLEASRPLRRRSPYIEKVREGVNTRGANGVFFVRVVERQQEFAVIENLVEEGRNVSLPRIRAAVEKQALRYLLRGSDVQPGVATPSAALLFFHDVGHVSTPIPAPEVERKLPSAYAFAKHFEEPLRNRKKFQAFDPSGDHWLGLYSVTTAALADHKVVVREIASGMIAAPVHGSEIIPDHKLHIIPCRSAAEADRLSEILNSRVVDYLLRSFSISTSITGSFLRYIGIRDLAEVDPSLEGDEFLAAALGLTTEQYQSLDMIAAAEIGQ